MKKILFFIALLGTIALIAYGQNQKASDQGVASGTAIPTGTIMAFAGSSAPTGWVLAYGQQVSQTGTYAKLYAAISTTYCTTDHGGTCTGGNFRIPDLRGRFLGGKDNMGGTAATRITSAKTIDGTVLGKGNGDLAEQVTQGAHSDIDIAHGHGFTNPYDPAHYHSNSPSSSASTAITLSNAVAYATSGHRHNQSHTHIWRSDYFHNGTPWFGEYSLGSSDPSTTGISSGNTFIYGDWYDYGTTGGPIPGGRHSSAGWSMGEGRSYYTTGVLSASSGSGSSAETNTPSLTSIAVALSGSQSVTGTFGLVTGGCNGNAGNTCQTTGGSVTALGTTNKTISAHAAINNLPPTVIINYIIKI